MQSVAYPQNTEDATKLASLSNCPNNCATRTRQMDESCRPRIEGEALRTAGGGGLGGDWWVGGWGLVRLLCMSVSLQWAVVKQHVTPLFIFQMDCLQRICGMSMHNRDTLCEMPSLQLGATLFVCVVPKQKTWVTASYFRDA